MRAPSDARIRLAAGGCAGFPFGSGCRWLNSYGVTTIRIYTLAPDIPTCLCNVILTGRRDDVGNHCSDAQRGTGKTLLCQVLASSLAPDMQVIAIDADPTGALSRWAERAYEGAAFEVIAEADETRLAHLIAAKADAADLTGRYCRLRQPCRDGGDDECRPGVGPVFGWGGRFTEAERTVNLVAALARAARRDIPTRVIMNRVKRTTLPVMPSVR